MEAIWKYKLEPGRNVLMMPRGAKMLYAREQAGDACVWAMVLTAAVQVERVVYVVGTGHPVDGGSLGRSLGCVHLAGGALVFHVFEARGE